MAVYRCFVEKKTPFAVEAAGALSDLRTALRTEEITGVRVLNRYDIENIEEADYKMAQKTILSEPQVDDVYEETAPVPAADEWVLAVEYLPGQFDQRADSCAQCIQLVSQGERPGSAHRPGVCTSRADFPMRKSWKRSKKYSHQPGGEPEKPAWKSR